MPIRVSSTQRLTSPTPAADRPEFLAVTLTRFIGAGCLFAYHFLNDLRLQSGSEYSNSGLLGFLGYFGVASFIVLSGVVLGRPWERHAAYLPFVLARLRSLFALFWWVAIPLLAAGMAFGTIDRSEWSHAPLWLFGLNFLSPDSFLPLVDSWWYMGLAAQIVLLYPLIHWLVERTGGARALFAAAAVVAVSSLFIGRMPEEWHYLFDGFVGVRALELTFGVVIGVALRRDDSLAGLWGRTPLLLMLATALIVIQPAIYARVGAGVAAAAIVLGLTWIERSSRFARLPVPVRAIGYVGGLMYPFFLVHPPIVRATMTRFDPTCSPCSLAWAAIALCAGLVAAWIAAVTHRRVLGRLAR